MNKILNNIELGIVYSVVFLMPLFFLPFFPNNFDTAKLILLFAGFISLSLIKIVKSLGQKESTVKFTVKDLSVFLVVLVYAVSGIIKTPSIYNSFFVPGTSSFITLAGIYYLYVNQLSNKQKSNILTFLIISAVVLSILQMSSFLGYYKQTEFTTFGSLTSSLIFLLSVLPISIFKIIKSINITQSIAYGITTFVIFVSGFSVVYLLLPGKSTSINLPNYSTSWSIAIDSLKTAPLLGIGPGNYIESFSKNKPLVFNQTKLWDVRFDTASSQILTILTETGILGVLFFILMLVLFFKKIDLNKPEQVSAGVIIISSLIIPFSYSLFTIFFILLAVSNEKGYHKVRITPPVLIGAPFLIVISILTFFAYKTVASEIYFAKSLNALSLSETELAYLKINKAIEINPKVDRYHLLSSSLNLGIVQSMSQNKDLSDKDRELLTQLIQQGITEAKAATALNPRRVSNWENLAKVYKNVTRFAKGADKFAIESYNQAIFLEPINPKLRIDLGGMYYSAKKYEEASRIFELAVTAKPDFANSHYNLATAYRENGQTEKAKQQFEATLTLVEKGSEDYQLVTKELEKLDSFMK